MKCEHFIYALFNGSGYQFIASPCVEQTLSEESIELLCHIGDYTSKPEVFTVRFPKEDVLSVSYVKPTVDEYNRKGVYNHTILIPIKQLLSKTSASIEQHFITEMEKPKKTLKPLIIQG